MPSATEFNEIVDALFDQFVEALDSADAVDDVELNQGCSKSLCEDGSKIIVNRHAPTQEIWVAAEAVAITSGKRIRAGRHPSSETLAAP